MTKQLMNALKKIIVVILTSVSLMAGFSAFAQQDALFSQYMFNQMILNPAYSGSRDVLTATLVHRNQWVGMDGAPLTSTFSVQTPLQNENVALGFLIYNDQLGATKDLGVMANYAYRIRVGQGRLAFGLQGGFIQQGVDLQKLLLKDQYDVNVFNVPATQFTPDVNFGVYYTGRNWYAGASSKHLFESLFSKEDNFEDSPYAILARHFYATAGFLIDLGDDIVLKPSALISYTRNAPVSVDINTNVFLKDKIMLGASYRTGRNAVVLLAEVTIREDLKIGYSYDVILNELSQHSMGSHEFMLSWDFDLYKRYEKSKRYF
ncbi:MAG: type IX secretion system membrane protein PorP/SprF [Bacteroidales bacterium]|jgi:type IX secretion system PorP/SprF family membrane protein|nr:type IX secretion system membrane protein PorP/SprF [Bacteroidales bacterium]MDY0285579.1 type IX secretion system membrane protein PorP/SprF [Bacteroidales bacterium]HPE87615.1 type IX secretion system membrane protein PorP/SprF [Bacteroidales bacterium]